eukprot:scaffold203194_cov23-Tisochrysis_lutea.AAC.1
MAHRQQRRVHQLAAHGAQELGRMVLLPFDHQVRREAHRDPAARFTQTSQIEKKTTLPSPPRDPAIRTTGKST